MTRKHDEHTSMDIKLLNDNLRGLVARKPVTSTRTQNTSITDADALALRLRAANLGILAIRAAKIAERKGAKK
jgi:hypothetical protein